MHRLLAFGLIATLGCAPSHPFVPPLAAGDLDHATRCGRPPSPGSEAHAPPGAVPVRIRYVDRMGNAFRRLQASFQLSGAALCGLQGPAPRPTAAEPVLHTHLAPGRYRLAVDVRLRGHGYGVFSYLKGYRFAVRSHHTFTVQPGAPLCIDVVAYESGEGSLKDRPRIRYAAQAPCTTLNAPLRRMD